MTDVTTGGLSADDLRPYRDTFKASQGRETTLTDAQLSTVLLAFEDQPKDAELVSAIQQAEGKPPITDVAKLASVASGGNHSLNVARAAKIAEDKVLPVVYAAYFTARDTIRNVVLRVEPVLRTSYTMTELKELPVLGTTYKKDDPNYSNNPDKYQYSGINAGTKKRQMLVGTCYTDMFLTTIPGTEITQAKKWLQMRLDKDPTPGNPYADLKNPARIKSKMATMDNRVKEGANVLGRTVRFILQMAEINLLPNVRATVMQDSDGPSQDWSPIFLKNPNSDEDFSEATVAQVLNFDVGQAAINGGTIDALFATLKREEPGDDVAIGEPWALDDVSTGTLKFTSFLSGDGNVRALLAKGNMKGKDGKLTDEAAQLRYSIMYLADEIEAKVGGKWSDWWQNVQAEEAAADAAKEPPVKETVKTAA